MCIGNSKASARKKKASKKPAAVDEDGANTDTTEKQAEKADKAEGDEAYRGRRKG